MTDMYWKNIFIHEFCYSHDQFPDLAKKPNESHFDMFVHAFNLYKVLRRLLKEMIQETYRCLNDFESDCDTNLFLYLSSNTPHGRQVHPIIRKAENYTLEFICLHKSLKCISENINAKSWLQLGASK